MFFNIDLKVYVFLYFSLERMSKHLFIIYGEKDDGFERNLSFRHYTSPGIFMEVPRLTLTNIDNNPATNS